MSLSKWETHAFQLLLVLREVWFNQRFHAKKPQMKLFQIEVLSSLLFRRLFMTQLNANCHYFKFFNWQSAKFRTQVSSVRWVPLTTQPGQTSKSIFFCSERKKGKRLKSSFLTPEWKKFEYNLSNSSSGISAQAFPKFFSRCDKFLTSEMPFYVLPAAVVVAHRLEF